MIDKNGKRIKRADKVKHVDGHTLWIRNFRTETLLDVLDWDNNGASRVVNAEHCELIKN